MTMHKALLLVPLCAAACSYPKFTASKVVEMELPAAQLGSLHCTTHNGGITVTPGDSSDTIALRAEMKVRGFTQDEADANLHLLSVGHRIEDGQLQIFGDYPQSELFNRSPSFAFTLAVPPRLALTLITHNGDIVTSGTSGALSVETHNGDIEGSVANPSVSVVTHNGDVELAIDSPGELAGKLETHNGNVAVALHGDAAGWLAADTHNGSISPPAGLQEATVKRSSLRGRIGADPGEGKLVVETHNGNIVFRTAAAARPDYR